MSFDPEELSEFKEEALELLEAAEQSLMGLDQGGEFKSAYDPIFRSLHNLKGAAGMMELVQLEAHTHKLEDLLVSFKENETLPKEYISLFLRGIDAARSILDGEQVHFSYDVAAELQAPELAVEPVQEPPATPANAVESEFAGECIDLIESVQKNLQALEQCEKESEKRTLINDLFRDVHTLKGSAFLMSCVDIGQRAQQMEELLEEARADKKDVPKELAEELFQHLVQLENLLHKGGNQAAEPLRIVTAESAQPTSDKSAAEPAAGSVRVSVPLLDKLMNLMGEMVLVRNQVLQHPAWREDPDFLGMSKQLHAITAEMQEEMMKTRMQPIANVFNKFVRTVRDLSQELHKKIQITVSGAETELDKSILESIKDPLTHIVRNACDHGIETPELRKSLGKPEEGHIQVTAYHQGGQVLVEVRDDGQGLSADRLVQKAVEKGLLHSERAQKMTLKEKHNLIFAPGFSTAQNVTSVSGRGVGMDVVRSNVEKIGGAVEVESVEGEGSLIRIRIPLTLAIIPALLVRCSDRTLAVPQANLEELIRIDLEEEQVETLHGVPVFRLRGKILPLVDLRKVLELPSSAKEGEQTLNVAVVTTEKNTFGLIMDQVLDTSDIVVKPLSRLVKSLQVYSGATILGDGSVSLILDVEGVAKVAHLHEQQESWEEEVGSTNSLDKRDYLIVSLHDGAKHAMPLAAVHRLEEVPAEQVELSGRQRVVRYGDTLLPLISAAQVLGIKSPPAGEKAVVVVLKKGDHLYGLEVNRVLDTLSTETPLLPPLRQEHGIAGNLNLAEELIVVLDPLSMVDGLHQERLSA